MADAKKMFGAFEVLLYLPVNNSLYMDERGSTWRYKADLYLRGNYLNSHYSDTLEVVLDMFKAEISRRNDAEIRESDLRFLKEDGWITDKEDPPMKYQIRRVLDLPNTKKIVAIRAVRQLTGMGLKEAKEYVEGPRGTLAPCSRYSCDCVNILTLEEINRTLAEDGLFPYFEVV